MEWQLLKNADEFSDAIVKAPSVADPLVKEAQNVFKQMDTTYEPIAPHPFWSRLKQRKPDFGQMTPQGGWMQHDAEECLTELLNCVNGVVKTNGKGLTDEHFRIEMDTVTTLAAGEGGSEEPTTKTDYTLKLSCHIQGNVKQADGSWKGGTDMMPQGIMNGLNGTIEKTSPSLGRMALYDTKSRVTRLPKYVVTQLMRFFYKQDTQSKAKVKRPVKFPFALDMHDYCVPELQKKIYAYRERKGEAQRLEEAEAKKAKLSHNETPAAEAGAAAAGVPLAHSFLDDSPFVFYGKRRGLGARRRRGFSPDAAARHPKFQKSRPSDGLFPSVSGPQGLRRPIFALVAERTQAREHRRKSPEKHQFPKHQRINALHRMANALIPPIFRFLTHY